MFRSRATGRWFRRPLSLTRLPLLLLPLLTGLPAQAQGGAGGQIVSTGGKVEVEVLPASAGYTSELWLVQPRSVRIATNRDVGTVVTLGRFRAGVELVFALKVQDTGSVFYTGPAYRNPDSIVHASASSAGAGKINVGFEDVNGGGDRDYDDCMFQFRGALSTISINFLNVPGGMVPPSVLRRQGYAFSSRYRHFDPQEITIEVLEDGEPPEDPITVQIYAHSEDGSAGHSHGGDRPHAWIYKRTSPPVQENVPVAKQDPGGSTDSSPLSLRVTKRSQGKAKFMWLAPEVSGVERLRARIHGRNTAPVDVNISVGISGLTELPPNPSLYELIRNPSVHTYGYYMNQAALAKIPLVAQDFLDRQRNDAQLQQLIQQVGDPDKLDNYLMELNDGSLPWGGMFDFQGNWHPPHGAHRWGDMIDIRTVKLVTEPWDPEDPQEAANLEGVGPNAPIKNAHLLQYLHLVRALRAQGIRIDFERPPAARPHLHVYF